MPQENGAARRPCIQTKSIQSSLPVGGGLPHAPCSPRNGWRWLISAYSAGFIFLASQPSMSRNVPDGYAFLRPHKICTLVGYSVACRIAHSTTHLSLTAGGGSAPSGCRKSGSLSGSGARGTARYDEEACGAERPQVPCRRQTKTSWEHLGKKAAGKSERRDNGSITVLTLAAYSLLSWKKIARVVNRRGHSTECRTLACHTVQSMMPTTQHGA